MTSRRLVIAALIGAVAAQPDARCNTEMMDLTMAGGTIVSEATCTALATFEGCIARITDRDTQSALEVALGSYQTQMQGCTDAPVTAAIRTERDAVAITGSQILFHRTVRQTVNIHELQEQVNTNEGALSATIASVQAGVTSTLAANTAAMQSRMDAAASTAAFRMDVAASTAASTATSLRADVASAQSSLADALDRLATTTAASVSTMNVNIGDQLSTAAAANLVNTRALNVSVQAAIVAANNAAVPSVYIQWGAKACTAPSSVTVTKLYDGIVYGSRHNRAGGGSTNLCLKNAGGEQGGVRQGGQDSNDNIVPIKRSHSSYNNLPSRNNLFRSRDAWIIPCAKCKYAKSCFEESGVAECPRGYNRMYTGYLHGGHEGHSGNNDRICIDKNPANNDYTAQNTWYGYVYPTVQLDNRASGLSRQFKIALACHMCCVV